jgi:hypothetical protein
MRKEHELMMHDEKAYQLTFSSRQDLRMQAYGVCNLLLPSSDSS